MKAVAIVISMGLSAFFMTGCGGNSEPGADNKPNITGKRIYNAPDNQKGCINNGHGFSNRYTLEINATDIVYNDERYSEEACDISTLDTNETYTFSYEIGTKIAMHLYDTNGSLQSSNFEKVDGYGIDMTLTAYSLHFGTLYSLPQTGRKFYGSFRLDGEKLHMLFDSNHIHNGETEEARVIEIGSKFFWTND